MKMTTEDFTALVERIMQDGALALMRPVVEKELLHYDILYCLDQGGLLDQMVFQGGTSLRLCHGGYDRTLGKEKFEGYLLGVLQKQFSLLITKLYGDSLTSEFIM